MKLRERKIAILGCGPTGLVAAHAAMEANIGQVRIFSKKRKSHMFGAQYLHDPIPGIEAGYPQQIQYLLEGSIIDYRRKVYGPKYTGTVSPDSLEENQLAWDIRLTYDKLYQMYRPLISDVTIDHEWLLLNGALFDVIISSVPAQTICWNSRHQFRAQPIWALGDALEIGKRVRDIVDIDIPEGTVICNGNDQPSWYRASRIFGHITVEWSPADSRVTVPADAAKVLKPIATDCDCWPGVTRIGRYGKWEKGVLVHHAWKDTMKCLADL